MNMKTLAHAVKHSSAQEIINSRCPVCGKIIRISYEPGHKAAIIVVCLSCLSGMCLDGVSKEPPWVSELGNSFETV